MPQTLADLTPELLRRLYLEELQPESQIARDFGTYQVQVNRLRKKWGIPTLGQTGRVGGSLPALTNFQMQVLTGSLLGDGSLNAPGPQTARFFENHCQEQLDYLRWKAEVLAPFTTKVSPVVKTVGDKQYHGNTLYTHSCTQFRPLYDLFYPAPGRVRVFPSDLPERMTPLVLAVWYMDDGSVERRGYPRISFGLGEVSLQRALRALRRLDLIPEVYGKEGDYGIHFPQQAMKFRELVAPYIIPCLAYKMPFESEQQAVHRRARLVTPDRVRVMYQGGLSADQIATTCGIGRSTVNRRLSLAGVTKRRSGPRTRVALKNLKLLPDFDPAQWPHLPVADQDHLVGEILGELRQHGFPRQPTPTAQEVLAELLKVRQAPMSLEDGYIQPIRKVGIALCSALFPNRYQAVSAPAGCSAFEAWHDDDRLSKAIRFQLQVGDPVYPERVLRAVTMMHRTPTVFRPTVARFIYERYCSPGNTVWDPCSGYGGRLLGAVAAGVKYIGTDVEEATVAGNRALATLLGDQETEVQCCPAERFDPPPVDLVFTSPPYFNQEKYAGGPGQSWRQYTSFEAWLEGFLRPVVRTAYRVSSRMVLNVADVERRPLIESTKRVAQEEGWVLEEDLRMPLPKLNRVDPWEPVLVFQR